VLDTIPSLKNNNDGLIFTPVDDKYTINARSRTLKWKPPHINTVHFLIKKSIYPKTYDLFSTISGYQLSGSRAAASGRKSGAEVKFSTFYCPNEAEDVDGKVGEFRFDEEMEVLDYSDYSITRGGWALYKIRTDKNNPKNIKVVFGLLDSIRDNISEKDLRSYYGAICEHYLKRKQGRQESAVERESRA
jgi:mRNA guanylyltransferase